MKKSARLTVRDVQGNPSSHHGTRHVYPSVGTRGPRANIDFQIADMSDNILILGKLLRNGFVFNLRRETDSIMYHQRDPTKTFPLLLHKNSLRIRANRIVHHVSPEMEEQERYLCGPRLEAQLTGRAESAVEGCRPGWLSHEHGVETLLRFLRTHCAKLALPDMGSHLQEQVKKTRNTNQWPAGVLDLETNTPR